MCVYACICVCVKQRKKERKKRKREMFYLTTHSTHFIYGYMASDIWLRTILIVREKEMFYLTTHSTHFYLRLYGVRHMVKDHSDSEKRNQLPPRRLLFPINSKGSFICIIPHTGLYIPRPLLHQSWSTGCNEK